MNIGLSDHSKTYSLLVLFSRPGVEVEAPEAREDRSPLSLAGSIVWEPPLLFTPAAPRNQPYGLLCFN